MGKFGIKIYENHQINYRITKMQDTKLFLVPDYYPYFQCKMGVCRHTCCSGWPISITMKDYFRLVGVQCSPDLRRHLDMSLHILPYPNDEEYAEISPTYDGNCPMQIADGRCGLQAELGEEALPLVCRLYPRGIRVTDDWECSCANSCEVVPELFLKHSEPIRFLSIPLSFELPEPKLAENVFPNGGRGQEIRLYYIRIMQNRSLSIPDRFMTLGAAMQNIEKALREDMAQLDVLLSHEAEPYSGPSRKPTQEMLDSGLKIIGTLLEQVDERSQSVSTFGAEALQWFARNGNSIDRYYDAQANFETVLPEWEHVFEHLMVNHMFFEQFPFQDRPVPVADEFLAICAVYALLRFLSVGWLAIHPSQKAFVDVTSALFRMIEHTSFDSFAAAFLRENNSFSPEQINDLIRL